MLDAAAYGFVMETVLNMPNDAGAHAEVVAGVLAGEPGPAFDQVVLTAGTLLWMLGRVTDPNAGIGQAREALGSGQAQHILESSKLPA
jgi:anthranilate phosphoribosyltransferase